MTNIIKNAGKNIKFLRINKGLSQKNLAKMIPMAQAFLSRIERGEQGASLAMLEKIARALDCDSLTLINGGQPEKDNTTKVLLPVPVYDLPNNDKNKEQNIVIEREDNGTIIRYILPPTEQTYKFLSEQLNKFGFSEQAELPDKAVVVTHSATAHNSTNCNNVTVGAKK